MEHFKSLSYDGFGINGRDEYRTRLATFAATLTEEQRREFGPLFAAAPEMFEALKAAAEIIKTARQYFPKSIKHRDRFALENTGATIGAALHAVKEAAL